MKLAVPDMISNSYFPAIAAIELGCFAQEGLDVSLELIFPVDKSYAALRDGTVDFVGGSAHSALAAVLGCAVPHVLAAETLKIASPIRGSWEGAIPGVGKVALAPAASDPAAARMSRRLMAAALLLCTVTRGCSRCVRTCHNSDRRRLLR
ncbi:MAG: hypothetical protein ACXWJO_00995 [Xanthobacteraceae bacterium]